jgi:uncharacterized membrane protein HdeD (DUF308 family)
MALSTLFLAAFLILFGINALGWVAISATLLGAVALIAGILILVEAYHPITIRRPVNQQ